MADLQTQVVVLGSGPGGYTAAFRAADLGKQVILVERYNTLGGVCLNVGCIPSKALLHVAKVVDEVQELAPHGLNYGAPQLDVGKILNWKQGIVSRLTAGLKSLAKQRNVTVVQGVGVFNSSNEIAVTHEGKTQTIAFEQAIIAVGSQPVKLPAFPEDPRIIDSTGALELNGVSGDMLVIGGGVIGMEMANAYHALGASISVVELGESLLGGVDADILKPFQQHVKKRYKNIFLKTKVVAVEAKKDGIYVKFEGDNAPSESVRYDRVLVSVGRTPNGKKIAAEKAGVNVDERGFIAVDKQLRTNVAHIFAIGDVIGQPMLAHKAVAEGRVAAEVIAGKKHFFDAKCIPSVCYTDPEVAWVGLTENEAKAQGVNYGKGVFPWAASGRSLSMGRNEGITKLIFDNETHRVLGAAIVGPHAGDLISEVGLAIEMGCDAQDIALTVHPHPTLSETIAMATEIFEGTITDLYMPKKEKA